MGIIGYRVPKCLITSEARAQLCDRMTISASNEEYGKLVMNLLVDAENLKQGKQR